MNTVYLVCIHHPEMQHSLRLGARVHLSGYTGAPSASQMEKFFATHKHCGHGCDHFTLAFEKTKDHDIPLPAPVANTVHLALREAANEP